MLYPLNHIQSMQHQHGILTEKKKYIDILEKAQRRFTKIAPELRNLSYSQRLTKINLTSLK